MNELFLFIRMENYLNRLPSDTEDIDISCRQLTVFPTKLLSRFKQLKTLNCCHNQFAWLPPLNESLENLLWYFTPIYALLNGKRENIAKFNWFREYYFLSKLKKKFLSWMWKSREKAIREQFHYKHLVRFMEENDNDGNVDLDPFLENFTQVN
jgi:hypothetical protein